MSRSSNTVTALYNVVLYYRYEHEGSEEGDTYIFVVVERVKDVVRQAREQVDDEPALEVVHADDFGVGDHLAAGADERRVEVEDDVDEEDDVDDGIDDEQTHVLRRLVLEGHVVGHHDGGVEGETEDDPVPQGLEGAVVQQDVRRCFGRLLTVLRQHIRIQAHHLKQETMPHLIVTCYSLNPLIV